MISLAVCPYSLGDSGGYRCWEVGARGVVGVEGSVRSCGLGVDGSLGSVDLEDQPLLTENVSFFGVRSPSCCGNLNHILAS